MSQSITHPVATVNERLRRVRFSDCLQEVTEGVGSSWKDYRVIGATRDGLAPAKEAVGKYPERYKLVEPGTIFYNPMRILIGSIAFVDEGERPGITSPDYVVFRSRSGIVHPRWLYYWLRSDQGAAFIKTLARGAVRERMLFRRLATAEISLPPYDAQTEFANLVLAVERARAVAEAQLEAAKGLPAAYLRAVFNTPEAQQWPKRKLGEVCEIVARQVDPKLAEFGALPHVNGENIEGGTCRLMYLNTAAQEGMMSGKYLFEPGDVLYSKLRPYLRKVVVADFRGVCSADMYPIRVNQEVFDPYFTAWLLLSDEFTKYADDESRRARMPKLNRDQLFAWHAPIPPLLVQRRIRAILSEQMAATERTRKALEEQLDTTNKLPAALLRRAFSGEL